MQVGIGEASTTREAPGASGGGGTCEDMRDHQRPHHHPMAHDHHHQQQHQHHHPHHQIATTAFHISRPSHPISTIISPPPLQHTSIILDQDSYHISRILLQNENFQVINNHLLHFPYTSIFLHTQNMNLVDHVFLSRQYVHSVNILVIFCVCKIANFLFTLNSSLKTRVIIKMNFLFLLLVF